MQFELTRAVGQANVRVTINSSTLYHKEDRFPVQLLLYPVGDANLLPELRIQDDNNISMKSTEIRRPDHIPRHASGVGINYVFTKHPANARSSITVSRSGYSKPASLRIPPRHTLETIKEIIIEDPNDEVLRETIIKNSPEEDPSTALSNFCNDAQEIMSPKHFFNIVTALGEKERPTEITTTPAWWIADWFLGFWGGRRAQDEAEVLDIIEQVQHSSIEREVDTWGVFGEAMCGPIAAKEFRSEVPSTLQETVFDGRAWSQLVSPRGLAIVVLALNAGGTPDVARDIARDAPSLYDHDTYDEAKEAAKGDPKADSEAWARLLPAAAEKDDSEWLFVLSNTAYWIAEKARQKGYLRTATALHPVAAGLAHRHDLSAIATKADARGEYSHGLLKVFEDRHHVAKDSFDQAISNASTTEEHDIIDNYIWLSAIEQGAITVMRRVQWRELDPTEALQEITEYLDHRPPIDTIASTRQEQYEALETYLHACQKDLTARIVDSHQPTDEQSDTPTGLSMSPDLDPTEPHKLAQQAHEKYQTVGRTYDAETIADRFGIS